MNQKISGYKDILIYLNKLESDFPVQTWRALDFHIWPVIRISLGLKLYFENFFKERNQIITSRDNVYSESLKAVYRSIICSIKDHGNNQKFFNHYDTVFLNVSSTRYFKSGDRWFNPFSDSFINFFEKENLKSLVLEYVDTDDNKIPRYKPSKYITSGVNFMNLKVILKKKFGSLNLKQLPDFEKFLSEINISETFFLNKILRVHYYSKYFEKIFRRTNPSLAILEGYFSYLAMGFTLAAKNLEIKSVDIQHGIQSEFDFLYSKWLNIPTCGYETLPDYFWCWSDVEKNNINEWTEGTSYAAFTGGNPVLEINENDENIKLFKEEIKKIKSSKKDSINILYTHQASFELPQFFIDVLKNSPSNWIWWIRFHPQYMGAKEKILSQLSKNNLLNTITENVTEYPLAMLMKNMDLHVTEYSSSVLEAEMTGVPSIYFLKQEMIYSLNNSSELQIGLSGKIF